MRNIHRSAAAVVVILVLAVPLEAGRRPSPRSGGIMEILQRLVVRVASRISPPIGNPAPEEPAPTTTTGQR